MHLIELLSSWKLREIYTNSKIMASVNILLELVEDKNAILFS